MQSNSYIVFSLILGIIGIFVGVGIILNAPYIVVSYSSIFGLIISLISLSLSVKGNKVIKTVFGSFSFLIAVISIIINMVLLIQWIACTAFDFIAANNDVGIGLFSGLF